ncbi:hypothetical protein FD755_008920 [Muntiacus reevesi]|uniref:Uncharacterized protein n=1 Tax=Muntiacus reevesi TaxID=9886 RepID=A0A5J5MLA5_MUNRE|nr:hypothetical protein FD755_008920 [Muntiacus reevesi]
MFSIWKVSVFTSQPFCPHLCVCQALPACDDLEWGKLIMVHHWPATVCQEVRGHCKDPPNYWTIHGLWPDKSEACNRSWPFNPQEIKVLTLARPPTHLACSREPGQTSPLGAWRGGHEERSCLWMWRWCSRGRASPCYLDKIKQRQSASRPDALHEGPSHEWKKHGTCAAQLDALNSQWKYFSKSLDLYKELALSSVLQKLGIEPSTDRYYQVSDIRDALVSVYKVVPKVQCFLLEKGQEVQLLGQMELCFSKDLQLLNCTHAGEPAARGQGAWPRLGLHVCEDGPVLYPPLNQTKL